MNIHIHEITDADINNIHGPLYQKIGLIRVWGMMGRVLPNDVGKRVYKVLCNDGVSYTYQIESNKQRNERLSHEL